jgi:hypothetical protein
MNPCTASPISWLKLEQYHLGELSEQEARAVAGHLDRCPACAACSALITGDGIVLSPLPSPEPSSSPVQRLTSLPLLRPLAAGLAVAATALLILALLPDSKKPLDRGAVNQGSITAKGGEISMTLVRERAGQIERRPAGYASGDRFTMKVTAPGSEPYRWDVAVFQGDEVFFPYDNETALEPGNQTPVPGAFRLTGTSPTTVCFIAGDPLPTRRTIRREGYDAIADQATCRRLAPE